MYTPSHQQKATQNPTVGADQPQLVNGPAQLMHTPKDRLTPYELRLRETAVDMVSQGWEPYAAMAFIRRGLERGIE